MANFLLTFHGGSMPESKEEQDQVMTAWTTWFGTLGDALVDGGNPISQAKAISPDGSVMDATSAPSGYSIIKADSLDAAVALAKGCPVLAGGATVARVGDVPGDVAHAPARCPVAGVGRRRSGQLPSRIWVAVSVSRPTTEW